MQLFFSNIILIVTIFLSGYFLFYIPGKVTNKILIKNKNDFVISICLGFSIFTLISFFIYEFNLKITTTVIIYILINSLFLFFFQKIQNQNKPIKKYLNLKNLIYKISIIGLIVLLFSINTIHYTNDGSDMWYYLAIVRSFINDGYFSNISPWFGDFQSSYPSNSFFLYLTIISHLLPNTSLLDVFRIGGIYSTGISIFINILVLNFFIKNIKHSFLIISSIFVISFLLGDNLIFLMTNYPYYPKQLSSIIFIPVLIYIFFTRIYEKKLFPIFLTLILISFINQSSINLIIAGLMIFVFLIIEIKWEVIKIKIIRILIPLIITTFFFYFYLAEFYFTPTGVISNYSNNLSINASAEGPYYGQIIEIFKNYYIYSPTKYFSGVYYFYLLLFVFTVLIFKIIFKKKELFYHYLMLIITFLIVFNPISIFILNELMPINLIIRLNKIFIGYFFLGCLIGYFINNLKLKKQIYQFLLISTTACLFILSLIFNMKNDNIYQTSFKELEKNLNSVEPNSFIVTDKYSSNKLLAFKKIQFLISHENWLKFTTPEKNFEKYYNIYNSDDSFLDINIFKYLKTIKAEYLFVDKRKTKNYEIIKSYENFQIIFENNFFLLIKI